LDQRLPVVARHRRYDRNRPTAGTRDDVRGGPDRHRGETAGSASTEHDQIRIHVGSNLHDPGGRIIGGELDPIDSGCATAVARRADAHRHQSQLAFGRQRRGPRHRVRGTLGAVVADQHDIHRHISRSLPGPVPG
jgi:hypothetical protein